MGFSSLDCHPLLLFTWCGRLLYKHIYIYKVCVCVCVYQLQIYFNEWAPRTVKWWHLSGNHFNQLIRLFSSWHSAEFKERVGFLMAGSGKGKHRQNGGLIPGEPTCGFNKKALCPSTQGPIQQPHAPPWDRGSQKGACSPDQSPTWFSFSFVSTHSIPQAAPPVWFSTAALPCLHPMSSLPLPTMWPATIGLTSLRLLPA